MQEPTAGTHRLTLSAVIPTRNRPDDLQRAVASVLGQRRLPDELLVIDQSITDESERRVLDQCAAAGAAVRLVYVRDPGIHGLVPAKARGFRESRGDVVSFLEDDVVLLPDYFQRLEQGFLEHPAMLGCSGVVTQAPAFNPVYLWFFRLFHRGIFSDPRVDLHGRCSHAAPGKLVRSRYLSGGVSAYRRQVLEQIPFDMVNDFFMLEDIEYSMRASKALGEDRFYVNTGVCLEHRMSAINRERAGARWERKLREYICFYKKHRDEPAATFHLCWLLFGLGLEAVFASLRMLNPAPLVGTARGMIHGIRYRLRPL